jgi:ABC-type antimicrobial peptide transport system permease subunit
MAAFRRIVYPLGLAWTRLVRRGERVVLVAFGIAAGAALLAAVLAGSLVAQDRSVERATARVPAEDRTVRLVWGGIASGPGTDVNRLDEMSRRALAPLVRSPTRAMLFRTSQSQGHLFDLGAIDGLARYVHVVSGRLPRRCTAERCEVLQLGGAGPIPHVPGLSLDVVGKATLDSALPFGNLISRETYASVLSSALLYHTAPTPPLLLANGVEPLARIETFVPTFRSYTWAAPLRPGSVHPWTIESFARKVTQIRSALQFKSLRFDLTAPIAQLRAANEEGKVAGRRLLLIGGEAAALLLAFAVLAATGLRRDSEAQWRRLTWFGARRWQLVIGSVAEIGVVAFAGAVIGWAVGSGIGALVANRAGVPAGDVLAHSVGSGRGFALAAGIAVAAALVVLLSLRAGTARVGALTVTPVDAAAAGALVAIVLALARGAADTQSLANEQGTGAVLLLLPALIAFVAAVVWARILAPALRALERRARNAPVPARLAALSLARNPGRAAVAVAFLVVSLGLALFAETYRATLVRGENDQAAFTVPADFVVREDLTKLVPVLQAAPLPRFRALADSIPVLRLSGNVGRLEGSPGLTLLGIPADDIPKLRWRSDYSSLSRDEIADRLRPAGDVSVQGVRLPPDVRRLVLPFRAHGDELAVRAVVLTRSGTAQGIRLGTTTSKQLAAKVPAGARGGLLLSFVFDLTNTGLHGVPNAGINAPAIAQGTLRLGRPRADGRELPLDFTRWLGTGGLTMGATGRIHYIVTTNDVARLRARQPTDDHPIPIVASERLAQAAGPGGVLPLNVGTGTIVGRIAGTVRRIPTVDEDVVIADGPTVATALSAVAPGSGTANEVWLDTTSGHEQAVARALQRPPFDAFEVQAHDAVLHDLRSEPLSRGTLFTLAGGALAALALALVGLLLVVVSDLRDERGELFDLEAQGAPPSMLRRHIRLRTALVAIFGLVGGIATGAALAALVVALVTLTASASPAELPLLLGVDWAAVLLGAVVYFLLAWLLVSIATRRAFRADVAGRFAEVGT